MSLAYKAHNKNSSFIVAIDGTAASGKSLVSSMLADKFSLSHIESGMYYRMFAYRCLQESVSDVDRCDVSALLALNDPFNTEGLDVLVLKNEKIGVLASELATIKELRYVVNQHINKLLESNNRLVVEGRDISTVVLPNADLKIFMMADINVRAVRRYEQIYSRDICVDFSTVLSGMQARDIRDSTRDLSPLSATTDGLVINTTSLSPEDVLMKIDEFIYSCG
ncbi:(d)CMP kinase [Rickettsia endosymbiont of Cardiosporidium cionae]|uniref:(d)CMP kinase n=1 Tax=Rickettsia endosymbiont of Cardiosporidium cionae TaxID=2777155 RepID=UPI0018938E32|nr:(d)CMP kinase [Rickettsia endosymbiont of Cardiosporidium cionae]KAF8818228.1 cytidylate kinase [Rickettsia endosymbiont of Cardiosporidium cionae]